MDHEDVVGVIVNQKVDINSAKPEDIIKIIKNKKKSLVKDEVVLEKWIDKAIEESKEAVQDYKDGKDNAISAIIGKVMKLSSGKADAPLVRKLIIKKINRN